MKLSILDLVPLRQGGTFKDAIDDMVGLAKKAESLGYDRYWIAEHHNTKSIASSATTLLMQLALSQTESIRIGSGGVMLPNHSPYLVAEEFGTLETLYPNRVDLGLGRAPGTDSETAQAIRRTNQLYPDFKGDLEELTAYFEDTAKVHAYPAAGLAVPKYILGSSTDSAYLAAEKGLPYVFAAHFAPRMMEDAIEIYRRNFQPSQYLDKPYVILAANAVLADTDEEARYLETTQTQSFLSIVTNEHGGLKPPLAPDDVWKNYIKAKHLPHFGPVDFSDMSLVRNERRVVEQMTEISLVGSPETAKQQLAALQARVEFDELMVNSYIYHQEAQQYSYQLLRELVTEMD